MKIQKLKQKILKYSLKKQMIILFLPLILFFVLMIGIFSYSFEVNQVQSNALYLINNTVLQTGNILNAKMSAVFTQLSQICDSTSVSSLFNDQYDPKSSYEKYDDVLNTYSNMNDVYNTYSDVVDSMFFKTNHGTEIPIYKDLAPAATSVNLNQWMKAYHTSKYGFYWQNIHNDQIFQTQPPRRVMSLFKIVGSQSSDSQMLLIFNLKPDYFVQLVENAKISKHGYMIIASKDSVLYPAKLDQNYCLKSEDISTLQNKSKTGGLLHVKSSVGQAMLVNYHPLMNNEWLVAAVVPESDLTETFSGLRYVLLIFFILLTGCFTLLCLRIAATISQPIEQLSKKVSAWKHGDENVDFSTDSCSDNEINILSQGLHSLKNTVTELLQQVRREQRQKYKMELLAMQAQIKPHFLYNTLASVKNLVDMNDNQRASVMCDALEKYYRIGVSDGKEIISVRQEVEHVSNYLQIQRMRYKNDFDFVIDVDETIMACDILKITLQPLVENAIYHGIKQKEGKGTIVLSGERNDDRIVFSVYDDGAGMEPDKLADLRKSIAGNAEVQNGNFGLRNVSSRLKLFYGKDAGLSFDSVKGMFTEVKVIIPINGGEERYGIASIDHRGR